jgi:hypothetical protein
MIAEPETQAISLAIRVIQGREKLQWLVDLRSDSYIDICVYSICSQTIIVELASTVDIQLSKETDTGGFTIVSRALEPLHAPWTVSQCSRLV